MSVGATLVEHMVNLSTIALHIYFLYRTLDTKIGKNKQIIAGAVFICIRMAYYFIGFGYRPFFSVIACFFYAGIVFSGKVNMYLIWSTIAVVLDGIVDAAIINLYLLLPNAAISLVDLPGITRIILLVTSKAVLFLIYHLITRKIDKGGSMPWHDVTLLGIFPVGCWLLLEIVFKYSDTLPHKTPSLLLVSGSTFLLLMMASVIALYNRITANAKELAQSKLQLRTVEMTQDHIGQINDLYAKLSSVRHDLHNHFSAISGYLKAKDYEALSRYMNGLVDADMDSAEYVKHPVLNTLIGTRMAAAKEADIDFTISIMLPDKLPINDVDLCILMSNVLDNAFEANERVTDSRFISLHTRVENAYWVVACRNATCKRGRFRAAGALKSTKEAMGVHGIGTKQIQKIAEKTGGFVTYRHENYEFSTLVMIKLPQQ